MHSIENTHEDKLGTGFTEKSCREVCKKTVDCAVFILGKENGWCNLYRASAAKGCTTSEAGKAYWAMYAVEECSDGQNFSLFRRKACRMMENMICNVIVKLVPRRKRPLRVVEIQL